MNWNLTFEETEEVKGRGKKGNMPTSNKGMRIFLVFLLICALVAIYGGLWSINFLLYSYGLVFSAIFFFAGVFIFLLGFDRRQGINPEKGPIKRTFYILVCLGIAIYAGYSSWLNVEDVPDYVNGRYLTVSGTPSFVHYNFETNSEEIDIKGHDLTLKARKISETHYGDYAYIFVYLPHSGFIVKFTETLVNP